MYRDLAGAVRDGRVPGDEPGGGDGRSAADGTDLRDGRRLTALPCDTPSTSSSSGAAPAAGRWSRRSRPPAPASSSSNAAASCRARRRTGIPPRSGSTCGTAPRSDGSTARRGRFSVHALLRRRQHEVLGQRPLSPADGRLRGGRARRRRLAGLANRLRRAGAVLRAGGAAVPGARRCGASTRRSLRAGPYPHPPIPHAPEIAGLVDRLRAEGLHPSPLPLGLIRPGEADGCILCNTCNSFPCRLHAKSEAEVCCVRPATTHPNVTLWTHAFACRLLTDASGRRVAAVEVDRGGEGADDASRRRSSSSRAARSTRRRCCCVPPPAGTPAVWRTRRDWSAGATWRTWRP